MIASEVAIARLMLMPSSIVSAGTIRKPPPTPKNPVIAPTTSPAPPAREKLGSGHPAVLIALDPSLASPRRNVSAAAASITGTNARIRAFGLTCAVGDRPEICPDRRGRRERQRDPPAELAVTSLRARADGGSQRDDDERRGRRGPDALAEDVNEDRKRENGTAAADRADDQADREPERYGKQHLHTSIQPYGYTVRPMTDLTPELADLIARRFSALAEPTRLRLLNLMHARGEASVGELVDATGGTQANVSKHLGVLLRERMVTRRRVGSHAFYSIADPTLIRLCDEVCTTVREQLRELSSMVETGGVR